MPASAHATQGPQHRVLSAISLSRRLSANAEVSNISLEINRGDIVGLLGLNGAGKTTTLRMLSGVLAPDEGSVTIKGHSLSDSPIEARRQVGFLPDQPPLYNDMRVSEYLRLAGRIRGLKGNRLTERQDIVTEQCMLESVNRSLISTLSKGFRQRVGLAQALIHEPALLLLDEPSNGLDPQQLESMRNLIIETGKSAAVILSTHLLSEAQTTCNRVAIIHDGKLVADRPANGEDLEQIFHGATR
ncbi:MAG: ABC-2 type transport system ATP-binding protein [bacterium]|jgi:ABC-2 type transport system ATP-binding protein